MSALTSLILSSLLDELVLDATLQSHHEIARSRAVCQVCKTRCNAVHVPPALNNTSQQGPSRSGTPSSNGEPKGTGANTPTNGRGEGSTWVDCILCKRQVAPSRYAPHLSSCMGLASSRRGAQRSNSKTKAPSDAGRSASPSSELGSDEVSPTKGKGRDESEYSLKRKRQSSPQVSPTKKAKGRPPAGSPISRVKADAEGSGIASNQPSYSPANKSQSRVPSKLRDSSTARLLDRSPGSSSSRSSSEPEVLSVPTPASSFTHSPSLSARGIAGRGGAPSRGRPLGTGPPKRPSPPRPPPVIHSHFAMDVDEGDETGSSTDTSDSS